MERINISLEPIHINLLDNHKKKTGASRSEIIRRLIMTLAVEKKEPSRNVGIRDALSAPTR